jgi:glycosyltransferase involved in cell wall biosynthesis
VKPRRPKKKSEHPNAAGLLVASNTWRVARLRVGINPFKRELGRGSAYEPKSVTVGVLTFVPFLTGYYAEKLEILKICLRSLQANTTTPFDLLVVDNGSCDEAVQCLLELYGRGEIQYLLLSSENLGVYGGTERIFRAAPGEIVAYSQDDIFFHPGWLESSLEILETFPDVGFVTGCPVRQSYDTDYSRSAAEVPAKHAHVVVHGDRWRTEFDTVYAESTGESPVEYVRRNKGKVVPLYEVEGVEAFPVGAHFQFVIRKDVAMQALPFPFTGNTMGGSSNPEGLRFTDVFDAVLDRQGYAKYSTPEIFTEHLGNVLGPRVQELSARLEGTDRDRDAPAARLGTWQRLVVFFFRLPLLWRLPHWVTTSMERVSYWKRLHQIDRDRE